MNKLILSVLLFYILGCSTTEPSKPVPQDSTVIQKPKPKAIPGEVVQEDDDFSEIDKHALKAPASVEKDLQTLVNYLIRPAKTEKQKARAIFRWISDRVAYDTESFFSGNYKESSSDAVLVSRSSVCEGYANLFLSMATLAGLESVKISGYSKGYGYTPGSKFTKSDHAWNAVKINGAWKLLDSTWAAGYVNGSEFVKRFENFYFLTPPERFINDHLPEKSEWQLLEKPIRMEEYSNTIKKQARFYTLGLSNLTPSNPILKENDSVKIEMDGPENIVFLASLNQNKEYSYVDSKNGKHVIHIKSPGKGQYKLSVFAKEKSNPGMYDMILEYDLEFKNGSKNNMFVMKYSVDSYLYYPIEKFLDSGKEYSFKIDIPNAIEMAFIDSAGKWTQVKPSSGNTFIYKGKFPKGDLKVAANFGEKSWPTVLVYSLE